MNALQVSGSGTFPTFVSVSLVDLVATIVLIVVLAGVAVRFLLLRKMVSPGLFRTARSMVGVGALVRILISEIVNKALLQKSVFYNTDKTRRVMHLAMFWGFVGLMVTTTLDFLFNRAGNYIPLFGGSLSPIRLLGNVSGVVMMVGATVTVAKLIAVPKFRRGRVFGDAWFATLLFITGLTGFITEFLGDRAHMLNPSVPPAAVFSISLSASPLIVIPYGLHLVCVTLFLVTAPASMFIHALTVPSNQYLERLGTLVTTKNQERKLELIGKPESQEGEQQ